MFREIEYRRVSSFSVVVILCGALALLAGCATSPTEAPPNWNGTNQVQNAESATNHVAGSLTNLLSLHTNLASLTATNRLHLNGTNRPPATNVFKVQPPPVYTWTSLKRWTETQRINSPKLLAKSPLFTYAVTSDRGVMVLAIGTREATWNGVVVHLGFAPEFIDGEIYLHGLDLQKSLEPLLCEPPQVFPTNRIVVIDPGHGGMNAGTISVADHHPEKEFTLDWARRIKPLLEQEGWQVFLTRTNDVDIALSNRVTIAEFHHADLFLSLHFNSAAPDPVPVGIATYCLTPMGMPSSLTRGYPDILFQNFPNNNFDGLNMQLAERLQRALLHATGMEDRGVNRARFIGVLRGQRRPSVLIEGGFLSNPHEARRIADPQFRQKLAEAVATALK